jgi:hypothetical protein
MFHRVVVVQDETRIAKSSSRDSVHQVVNNNKLQNVMSTRTIKVYAQHMAVQEGVFMSRGAAGSRHSYPTIRVDVTLKEQAAEGTSRR